MSAKVRVLEFLQDNTKNKPNEDALCVSESKAVFAVADGVTQFVEKGGTYPELPTAAVVARAFCFDAVGSMSKSIEEVLNESRAIYAREIISAFRVANSKIAGFNGGLGADYFENDLAGCVGVLGVLDGAESGSPILHYGYIGDCGLFVFDKDLHPVFLSDNNNIGPLEQFREGTPFSDKRAGAVFWRRDLRNHPDARYLTYGVLTGEEEALSYVKTGSVSLEAGDTAILFSDGILPFIFCEEFRTALRIQLHSGSKSVEQVRNTISALTKKLSKRHILNLDDDKAFVAFSIQEL